MTVDQLEVEKYIQKLIEETNSKSKKFRYLGFGIYLLSVLILVAMLYQLSKKFCLSHLDIINGLFIIILYLSIVSLGIFFVRSLLSISNAYSLRCGQLEDIKIILMLNKEKNVPLEDGLKIILFLQRNVIKEMIRLSLPDNFVQHFFNEFGNKLKNKENKDKNS